MLENSAMPMKVKRNSLAQEGIRRLRNTSRSLPWSLKAEILSEFSHKLMISGYNEKFRLEIIQSAVRGYERQCQVADNGGTPLYRPRSYQRADRQRKKLLTPTSWYRPADSVIFVPATPQAKLAKEIQKVVTEEASRIGMTVKVVESGGTSMRQHLVRLDLTGCIYSEDCVLCKSGAPGASHTWNGVHYSGVCLLCENNGIVAKYDGESGRNGYNRTKQHLVDISNKETKNAFAKHLHLHHPDNVGDTNAFRFKSEQTFKKCLERQVKEGMAIHYSNADIIMNSKSEYHQPATTRVVTTREVRNGS